LGLAQNLHANYLWDKRKEVSRNKEIETLVGRWVEVNNLLEDRPVSICHFYFSPEDGKLRFDGTSYNLNGTELYRWWSVVLHIDERYRMLYVYDSERIADSSKTTGFGVVSFSHNIAKRRLDVSTGYFMSSDECRKRHIRMMRFKEVAELFTASLDEHNPDHHRKIVRALILNRDKERIQKAFYFDETDKK
jgi:hypothetical protein